MKTILFSIIFIFVLNIACYSQITVAQDGSGNYKSIQSAINAATSGTIITVKKGTYYEHVVLKSGINLVGQDNPTINAGGSGITVKMADKCTISGFTITNSGSETGTNDCGVYVKDATECIIAFNFIYQNLHYGVIAINSDVQIYYNNFAYNSVLGIYIGENSTFYVGFNNFVNHKNSAISINSSNAEGVFYNNDVVNCGNAFDYEVTPSKNKPLSIFNNIFVNNNVGIYGPSNFAYSIEYNCFFNNNYNIWDWNKQTSLVLTSSNIAKNPYFKDLANFNLNIETYSPCIDAGYLKCDIGSVNYPSGSEPDQSLNPQFQKTAGKYVIKLTGKATTDLDATKKANISMILVSDDGINFTGEAQFDDVNLWGHILMTGKKISTERDNFLTIDFNSGTCEVGNDNSGYPIGLTTSFTTKVTIYSSSASGKYVSGKFIPFAMADETGSFILSSVQCNVPLSTIIGGSQPQDITPPLITITSPIVDRGFIEVQQQKTYTIIGKATDQSGVSQVKINDEDVTVANDGSFTKNVTLYNGDNKFSVNATDTKQNTATVNFTIKSDQTSVVDNNNNNPNNNNTITTDHKYYALIIAEQDYSDPTINDLDNPVSDAQNLYNVLTTNYTFETSNVKFLKNPKREEITLALDWYLENLTANDNFLIFYAGHGHWDEKLQQGFWLPSDATSTNRGTWFSNSDLKSYIGGIASNHTLLISDACFGGSIFKTREAFTNAPTAIVELDKLPSRKAMTSGAMKAVPDKSVFIDYLVKRLQQNIEKYLSSEQLFSSFKIAVINNSPNGQIPQFGEIREAGDEGGDFIFIHK